MENFLFTSESVTEGHPDKMCDQISDAILDAIIAQDPSCRVACETAITTGLIMVMGEITTDCYVDVPKIVRRVVDDIGYTNSDFGFACDETPELMPMPVALANKLAWRLSEVRKSGVLGYLKPDGKTQVTVEYIEGIPSRVDTIIVSAQHSDSTNMTQLHEDIIAKVMAPVIPENMLDDKTNIYINPTGRFVIGGPRGDSGLTGRKIIVDTYGGYSRHGGGAFSGKDPTKVDRSAAYAARYVAKNIVAAGLAKKCEIQIAYAIGMANPVSIMIDTFRTGKYPDNKIAEAVKNIFDVRPAAIIKYLDLKKPIYQKLAAYGHMGREDLGVMWEMTDKVDELKQYFDIL
jgi:S-adenosylmethionine synthetase